MSHDDYIARLRGELLRAGASPQPTRQAARRLRPLLAAAAIALIVAAVVLALPNTPRDETPVTQPGETAEMKYRAEAPEQAARILQERLEAAAIRPARVSAADARVTISAPASERDAVSALTQAGRLSIYDWERSVIGPDGRPAPSDSDVTGGANAGRSGTTSKAEAEARAEDHDGVVVQAADGADGWYALAGTPALTTADIESARAGNDPNTLESIVEIELTPAGTAAFSELTRELAQRGADQAPDGDEMAALQHLAIVVDDRVVSVPFIDFRTAPDGIDGARGVQISGDLNADDARQLAALLSAGPLPAALQPQ